MALPFKAVQSTIASKEDGINKWYPRVVNIGRPVTTQEIAGKIAERSSLSAGDTHNVMRNFPTVLKECLMNGNPVNIEGLGTFRIVCKSGGQGVDTAEEVNANQINRLRIQFTPTGTRTTGHKTNRAIFNGIQFVKIDNFFNPRREINGEEEDGE